MPKSPTRSIRSAAAAGVLAFCLVPAASAQDEYEPLGAPSGTYELEKAHAYITFSYSHLGYSRPILAFRGFDASIDFNAEEPAASSVSVTIDADSVDTGVGEVSDFEEHIRDERFFHVAEHPEITFESTAVTRTGQDTGTVTGDLTIKGNTVPVTLEVTLRRAADHPMRRTPAMGFGATATVLRSDFGMGALVPNISDEVEITIEGEFILAEE